MNVDPSDPVVAAIGRGIIAETAGDIESARAAYEEAWRVAADDFERCLAAHYVPRTIDDPHEKLRWNEEALRFADAVGDERVTGFYPSLLASVGLCLLALGDVSRAVQALEAALRSVDDVPESDYRSGLTAMIEERLAEARGEEAHRGADAPASAEE
jgi:tetratricopeptide (TPR) repeat protein